MTCRRIIWSFLTCLHWTQNLKLTSNIERDAETSSVSLCLLGIVWLVLPLQTQRWIVKGKLNILCKLKIFIIFEKWKFSTVISKYFYFSIASKSINYKIKKLPIIGLINSFSYYHKYQNDSIIYVTAILYILCLRNAQPILLHLIPILFNAFCFPLIPFLPPTLNLGILQLFTSNGTIVW